METYCLRYIVNNMASFSNLNIVRSLSTTKNLGGHRYSSWFINRYRKQKNEVYDYARKQNPPEKCNANSVYMLVNIIEASQLARKR